jgi:formate hydrogenlyase transcriptional activator
VAATNHDLEKMVAKREFRSDLFYRLNVFPIRIPPLRHRREDIPLLVSYFVQKFAKQMQKKIEAVSPEVMNGLTAWQWPGNIRELENFIERAVILTRGKSLAAPVSEFKEAVEPTSSPGAGFALDERVVRIVKHTIENLEAMRPKARTAENRREEIMRALCETHGRVGGANGAAARMGINRTTLISRMKKLGIRSDEFCRSSESFTPWADNADDPGFARQLPQQPS